MEKEKKDILDSVERFKLELEASKEQILCFIQKQIHYETEKNLLRGKLDEIEEEINKLTDDKKNLLAKIEHLNNTLSMKEAEFQKESKETKEKINELEEKLSILEKEKSTLLIKIKSSEENIEKTKKEIEKLLKEKQIIQSQLDEFNKNLFEMNEKMIVMEKEKITLIETIRTNKKKIEKLTKEKGDISMEKDKFKSEIESLSKLVSELREKLNLKKNLKSSTTEKIKTKDSELERSNKEKNELIELKSKLYQEIERLKKDMDSASCLIKELKAAISNLEKEKLDREERMKEQLAIKNKEIEDISDEKNQMKEVFETLFSDKKDLLVKVDELDVELRSIRDQLINKEIEFEALKKIQQNLESEKNEIFDEKSKMTANLLQSSIMISKLEEEKTNLIHTTQEEMHKINISTENDLKNLTEKLSQSNLDNNQLKNEIMSLNRTISELNEKIIQQDKEKTNFSEKLKTHSKKLERLKTEKSETDLEKDKFLKESERLKTELDKINKLNFELRDKLNKKEKERSSLIDKLKQREIDFEKLAKEKNEVLLEKKMAVEEFESLTSKKLAQIKEKNVAKEEERIKLIDSLTQKNDLKNVQIENLKDEVRVLKEKLEVVQKEMGDLRKEKELMENKVCLVNQEIAHRDETIEFLNQRLKDQEIAVERILVGNEEISNEMMEKNRVFENRIKELSDFFEGKINSLQGNLVEEVNLKKSLTEENMALREKIMNLNNALSEISNKHETFKKESQQLIKSQENDIKDRNDQVAELGKEISKYIQTNQDMDENLKDILVQIDSYKIENLNLKNKLESEIKEKERVTSEMNQLVEKEKAYFDELDLKGKKYRKLEEEYQRMMLEKNRDNDFNKDMNVKLNEQATHLKQIESRNDQLLKDLENYKLLIKEKEDYIDSLKKSNQILSVEKQKYLNECELSKRELDQTQLEIKKFANKLVSLTNENSMLEKQLSNLRSDTSSLNEELKINQMENSNLTKNLSDSSNRYNKLKADYSNLHGEFEALQKTIKELHSKHQKQLEKIVLDNMDIVKDRRNLSLQVEKLENEKKELLESCNLKLKQNELEIDIIQLASLEKDKEMERLQKQIKDKVEKIKESENKMRTIEKRIEEKIEENRFMQRKLDDLTKVYEEMGQNLKINEREISQLKDYRNFYDKRILNIENLLSLKNNILTEINDKVDISIFFTLGLKDNHDKKVIQNVYLEFLLSELKGIKLFLEKSLPIQNIYSETHELILENNILSKKIEALTRSYQKKQEPRAKDHIEKERNDNILTLLLATPTKKESKTFLNSSNNSLFSSGKKMSDFESYVFSEDESEAKFDIFFEYLEHMGQKLNKKSNLQAFELGKQELVLFTSEMMIDCNEMMKFYNEGYKKLNKADLNEELTNNNIELRRNIMEMRAEIFTGLKAFSNFLEKNQLDYDQIDLFKTPMTLYHLLKKILLNGSLISFLRFSTNKSIIPSLCQKLVDLDSLYNKKFTILNDNFTALFKKFSLLASKLSSLTIPKRSQPKKAIPSLNIKKLSPSLEEKILPLIEKQCLIGLNEFQGLKKQIKNFSKKIEKKLTLQTEPVQPESGINFSTTPLKNATHHKYSRSEILKKSISQLKPKESRNEEISVNTKQKLRECLNSFPTQPNSNFFRSKDNKDDSALTERNYEKKDISEFEEKRSFMSLKKTKGIQEEVENAVELNQFNSKVSQIFGNKDEKIKITTNLESSTVVSNQNWEISNNEKKNRKSLENSGNIKSFLSGCLSPNLAGSKNFLNKYQGYSQFLLGEKNKGESADFREISSFQNRKMSSNLYDKNELIREKEKMMEEINFKNKIIEDLKREKHEQRNPKGMMTKESMNTSNQLYVIYAFVKLNA